jgi:hypothetical protein
MLVEIIFSYLSFYKRSLSGRAFISDRIEFVIRVLALQQTVVFEF